MRNILVVLSGPSGVGKGTIAKEIVRRRKNMTLSVSCTTRAPRAGEVNGREYFFITREEFEKKIKEGGFSEYSEHFGNDYGTPRDFVTEKLGKNDLMLEIDVNGGLNVKKEFPQAVLIMVLPPSLEELKHRLETRNTETEEQIRLRMERIAYETSKKDLYDYAVVNDDLETTVEKIREIIRKKCLINTMSLTFIISFLFFVVNRFF